MHRLSAAVIFCSLASACSSHSLQRSLKADGEACSIDAECVNARCLDDVCRMRCVQDADCNAAALMCSGGGCVPRTAPICGNGVVETGEQCDDHTAGCSTMC